MDEEVKEPQRPLILHYRTIVWVFVQALLLSCVCVLQATCY